ncbi:hypothetical protein [Enterococcus sp.]|uniref:hypothetical protein n=1 Tax=Enterococcus sp. TaxID=35783 RepID=UPI0028AC9802|nr:hypothetical protein [Enterococcus sp.]
MISKHLGLDDTYTYELTRDKSGFTVGTVDIEDFEEWSEENIDDLADSIVESLQPQLNENQENVLFIMKNIQNRWPHFHPSIVVDELIGLESEYHDALSKTEELQVFKIFMIWALEQEEE